MKFDKYRGIIPAFYACYDRAGEVSGDGVRALTRYFVDQGVKGVYVGGSSGECIYQSVEDRKKTLEAVMDGGAGRLTVIAHVACNNTRDSRILAAHAQSLGVDGIAAIPPIYFKLPEYSAAGYWNDISEAAPDTDFIIYNIPQLAGTALTMSLLRTMLLNAGLFHVALRGLAKAKGSDLKVIAIFCFVCVMADCTGGAGFVVMPPLGALIWAAMGRNPMAGMLAAYASVSGAFASNLMITSMDVVNMGYTEAAAKLLIRDISLSPSMNWYFSAVSVVFLTFFSTLITVKVVEPRMGRYTGDYVEQADDPTPLDNKGLKAALIAFLAYIALIVVLCVTGVLADETGSLLNSKAPLMSGMTVLIALMFAIPGIAFGYASGRFKKFDDVAAAMTSAMA